MMRPCILLLVVLLFAGCKLTEQPVGQSTLKRGADPFGNGNSDTPMSPIHYLEKLKQSPRGCFTIMTLEFRGQTWILAEDIKPLMSRLDSKIPCAGVISTLSSHLPRHDWRSTEDREAAMLIDGFRKGYYPPALASDVYPLDKEELRNWYQAWSKTNQLTR